MTFQRCFPKTFSFHNLFKSKNIAILKMPFLPSFLNLSELPLYCNNNSINFLILPKNITIVLSDNSLTLNQHPKPLLQINWVQSFEIARKNMLDDLLCLSIQFNETLHFIRLIPKSHRSQVFTFLIFKPKVNEVIVVQFFLVNIPTKVRQNIFQKIIWEFSTPSPKITQLLNSAIVQCCCQRKVELGSFLGLR